MAEGLNVSAAQAWYRNDLQHNTLVWQSWHGDNQLAYLLNRSTNPYPDQMINHLERNMKDTALGNVSAWVSAPDVLLDLDRQLRQVMIDPYHNSPLLGSEEDGTFILGYVQSTRMPAALLKGL